jgi:hypothetical protein
VTETPAPLHPAEVAALLQGMATVIQTELSALPPVALRWHPAPGEWCVQEVLGHIIEAERRGFAGRLQACLEQPAPRFEPWDQPAVARARNDCERNPIDLLGEFQSARAASASLVGGLSEADLQRSGEHPRVGTLRIADLLQEWVHHDCNHVKQMLANIQAFVWPHLGNAQRFSDL